MVGFQRYHAPVAGQSGTEETGSANEIWKFIPGVVYSIIEPAMYEKKAQIASPSMCLPEGSAYSYVGLDAAVAKFKRLADTQPPTDPQSLQNTVEWAGPVKTWHTVDTDLPVLLKQLRHYDGPTDLAGFGPLASNLRDVLDTNLQGTETLSAASVSRLHLHPSPSPIPTEHSPPAMSNMIDTGSPSALCASLVSQAPVPKKTCHGKRAAEGRPPLVINAGEGKTGTSSISVALAMLGLDSVHQGMHYTCTGTPSGGRPQQQSCQTLWMNASDAYPPLYLQLMELPIEAYEEFDYCAAFDKHDAYADTPFHVFAPHVYAAAGPGTKVIVTVKAVRQWAKRRAAWDLDQNTSDVAALGWMFRENVSIPRDAQSLQPTDVMSVANRSLAALEYAYIAELAMLTCLVNEDDLLLVDLEREGADPPKLWAKLANFIGRTTDGLDLSTFPWGQPGGCPAPEVVGCSSFLNTWSTTLDEHAHNATAYESNQNFLMEDNQTGAFAAIENDKEFQEEMRKDTMMCLKINHLSQSIYVHTHPVDDSVIANLQTLNGNETCNLDPYMKVYERNGYQGEFAWLANTSDANKRLQRAIARTSHPHTSHPHSQPA